MHKLLAIKNFFTQFSKADLDSRGYIVSVISLQKDPEFVVQSYGGLKHLIWDM